MKKNPVIAFIGGGNMAASLIGGLITDGWQADCIIASDPLPLQRETLRSQFSIHTSEDNIASVEQADIVVLAVKPQLMAEVAATIAGAVQQTRPLVISIAAGIRTADIDRWLGGDIALVRTMPNTPALVGSGATALYAVDRVSDEQRDKAESIMRAAGLALWVENEQDLDAVTAVSGSGPAYFFLVMEAMQAAAISHGLPEKTARLLTLETALGAARMALESNDTPAVLRERVTSPGGTTEAALRQLEQGDLRGLFQRALDAARDRATELADILGES
jgi:pyrroline-5-carboxylate reductase